MKNRIIAFLLALVITASVFTIQGFALLKGDMNGNGVLEIADAVEVLKIASDQVECDFQSFLLADMDMDFKITLNDARSILMQSVDLSDVTSYHNQLTPYTDHGLGVSTFGVVTDYCGETFPSSPVDDKSSPLYSAIPYGTFDVVTSDVIHDAESEKDFHDYRKMLCEIKNNGQRKETLEYCLDRGYLKEFTGGVR